MITTIMARFCEVQVLASVAISILLCNLALTSCENKEKQNVEDLISRILPDRAREFSIVIDKSHFDDENGVHLDSFEFHTVNKSILQITATSGVAAAWGFNHYLKYFCNAHISWSGSQLNIPKTLPAVSKPVKVTSPNRLKPFILYPNVLVLPPNCCTLRRFECINILQFNNSCRFLLSILASGPAPGI